MAKLYGFPKESATQLNKLARREGLKSRTRARIKYPQPLPDDTFELLGKPDANIAKGASGTISIWRSVDGAAETDTGENITAKALGRAVTSGKFVVLAIISGTWYVAPWE